MENDLNDFELAILDKIAVKYPFLQPHIPLLKVQKRKITGVGMYVDFCYVSNSNSFQPIPDNYMVLGSDSHLCIEGLEHGLAYEITVEKGHIDFLELVTYDEEWDGSIKKFWFG